MEIFVDNVAEYTFEKVDNTYFLKYNFGEQWQQNVKGTVAFSIIDTGNGLKISQDKKGCLNYSEALYLSVLLRLIHAEEEYTFETAEKIKF
jgi:hypothetical protein